ncbi:uncharacterized protein V6R79_016456 [Siganus canaliculatus]
MDISVLPNNNHPEKFLQLDVGMLPATHGMFQVRAAMSSQRHWQNSVYSQREGQTRTESRSPSSPEDSPVLFVDRYLEKHISPVTLKSNIKRNPLCTATGPIHAVDNKSAKPSWTIKDYDNGILADSLKVTCGEDEWLWMTDECFISLTQALVQEDQKMPRDLDFWLEDLYTPGFDSLLKKEEAEQKRKRLCTILLSVTLSVCAVLVVVLVPVVVLQKTN